MGNPLNLMVPRGRVELPLSYENRILSPTPLPCQIKTISVYRVQSVTYTVCSSDAKDAGNTCQPIVTVQSTGQKDTEGYRRRATHKRAHTSHTHRIADSGRPSNAMNNLTLSTRCPVPVLYARGT